MEEAKMSLSCLWNWKQKQRLWYNNGFFKIQNINKNLNIDIPIQNIPILDVFALTFGAQACSVYSRFTV